MERVSLSLSAQQVHLIAAALSELPYRVSAPVIHDMQRQMEKQDLESAARGEIQRGAAGFRIPDDAKSEQGPETVHQEMN
jgi:hypothetical protein